MFVFLFTFLICLSFVLDVRFVSSARVVRGRCMPCGGLIYNKSVFAVKSERWSSKFVYCGGLGANLHNTMVIVWVRTAQHIGQAESLL